MSTYTFAGRLTAALAAAGHDAIHEPEIVCAAPDIGISAATLATLNSKYGLLDEKSSRRANAR